MNDIKLVIFDMDGTICDSWSAMLYCYRETMKHYGRNDISDEEFYSCFTGYLPENLANMLHMKKEEIDGAVEFFRKTYEEKGHAMSREFDGILDCIRELHSDGYRIGLATMTLEKYAIATLKKLDVFDCFDSVHGSLTDGSRSKSDMIRLCISETGVSEGQTLMVGDGFNDKKAAEDTSVSFLAAAYGFGITKDNCIEYSIKYVESPKEVYDAVRQY